MANLPLAFAELLGGGVLLTAGISGNSVQDVFAGTITLKPFDAGTGAGDGATTAGASPPASAGSVPAGSPLGKLGKIIGVPYQGTHTLGNWQSDNAVDIAVPVGTPMLAVDSGVIAKVTRHPQGAGRFAGDQITLVGQGNSYFYAHGLATVKAGQHVSAGDVLGTSGSANGVAHLHFGQQHGSPLDWIRGLISGATHGHVAGVGGQVAR